MEVVLNVTEARDQLVKLLDAVEAGEEVAILRRDRPVARLVPIGRTLGMVRGAPHDGDPEAAYHFSMWVASQVAPTSRSRLAARLADRMRAYVGEEVRHRASQAEFPFGPRVSAKKTLE